MNKKIRKLVMSGALGFLLLLWSLPVRAAGTTEIVLKAGSVKEGDTQIQVSCELEGGQEVTSGKLRFRYDSSRLTLTGSSVGDALQGSLCEINDPLTGNKEGGEIVASFASAKPLVSDGSLVNLTFLLAENLKAGDSIEITVVAEQLAGDSGSIDVKVEDLTITVGERENPTETPTPSAPDGEQPSGEPNQGSESSKPTSVGTNTDTSKEKTATGKKSKAVKTGDVTKLWIPVFGVSASGVGIVAVSKIKKKRL